MSMQPFEDNRTYRPDEALQRLMEGNGRFVRGESNVTPESSGDRRERVVERQTPFATVLGCSDSRVSPSLTFDQGIGDLFVIRVAGNVAGSDVTASIQYAVENLNTPLVMVVGHQNCGAVTAALASQSQRKEHPDKIQNLLQRIDPAIEGLDPNLEDQERLQQAIESNVRWSVKQLEQDPVLGKALADQQIAIVGAVYELDTGRVRPITRV
jgi:carbonic anhydrase